MDKTMAYGKCEEVLVQSADCHEYFFLYYYTSTTVQVQVLQ